MATTDRRRGSGLLAVLWLSAALAAIAFSLSSTVREETDRASTEVDGLRTYYLAVSAVERASLELLWAVQNPDKPILRPDTKIIDYHFSLGDARVEVIPEAAKLNVNTTPLDTIYRLLQVLGIDPARAGQITAGIASWRQGALPANGAAFVPGQNPAFPGAGPSFPAAPASFQEIEELLLVRGVTPDIFYGTYIPAPEGSGTRLVPRPGLIDCLSVFGSNGAAVDANGAAPAVLMAIGLPAPVVAALVQRRTVKPFTESGIIDFLQAAGTPGVPLRVIGKTIVTYRASARLRLANGQLSDLKRTVASQVKYMPPGYDSQIHILRWYDSAWSN